MKNQGFYEYVVTEVVPANLGIIGRKMFGGYGLYKNGLCFALITSGKLFFKVNETNRMDYEQYGSKPFQFAKKNGMVMLTSYWEVPADIIEDREAIVTWIEKSVAVAQAAKQRKK